MDTNHNKIMLPIPSLIFSVMSIFLFTSCNSSSRATERVRDDSRERNVIEEPEDRSSSSTRRRRRSSGGGSSSNRGGGSSSSDTDICDREEAIRDGILSSLSLSESDCDDVDLSDVTSLRIMRGSVSQIDSEDLEGLFNLTELHIAGAGLTSISAGAFSDLGSLEFLNLMDNDLTTLPEGLFSDLTSLEEADLIDNNFSRDEQHRIIEEVDEATNDRATVAF